MPRILAVGHVTWDKREGRDVLGGSVSYSSLTAQKLGWEVGVLTAAGPDFEPERDLPGIQVFVRRSKATSRFENRYDADGARHQRLLSRADDVDFSVLPDAWRDPDVLLLGSVAREIPHHAARAFDAKVVGALAQGWLRDFEPDGRVTACPWHDPGLDLQGVHTIFLSVQDVDGDFQRAKDLLAHVPMVAYTRGWEGMDLLTREANHAVPTLPRPEVDPTGAGDVFAASFLVRYHETEDPEEAAAFASCAASCCVEGIGTSALGDRAEVERRLVERARLIEEGEWDE
jgi:sugar/nucleoside kinase (ribokinase family)